MVSVLMAAYREPVCYVERAIHSILDQSYRDLELIVLLDDPQNRELEAFLHQAAGQDPRIRFFVNERNLGLAATLNRAIGLCRGEYAARMDADDISLPHRLEQQKQWLEEHDLDFIGGAMQVVDEQETILYPTGSMPCTPAGVERALFYGQAVAHPSWFLKTSVYQTLQGYRPVPQAEDYDFTLRAALHGFKIGNCPSCVLHYRMSAHSISRSNLYRQYLVMCYLSASYRQKKTADLQGLEQYLQRQDQPQKAQKYSRSHAAFNALLSAMDKKQWGMFVGSGLKLLYTSPAYLDKIRRFALIALQRKLEGKSV